MSTNDNGRWRTANGDRGRRKDRRWDTQARIMQRQWQWPWQQQQQQEPWHHLARSSRPLCLSLCHSLAALSSKARQQADHARYGDGGGIHKTPSKPSIFQSPRDAGDLPLGGLKVPSIDGLLHSSEFALTTCFIIPAAPADCGPVQCIPRCSTSSPAQRWGWMRVLACTLQYPSTHPPG
ncbi:hypothetical protein N8I77_003916 [Diaporthe amygdali]|uniref:Uncharacterized protein n=1 Tax=Phomopsis amygdali TaxID=1214568 RepID=A0AAD9SKY5_PHOAM|nr:hypothetical protein N8I77_003916 [Diaporthe amygdali]